MRILCMPIVRPLFLHYSEDENSYRDDEFLFGPFMLIAPIFEKGLKNAKCISREEHGIITGI